MTNSLPGSCGNFFCICCSPQGVAEVLLDAVDAAVSSGPRDALVDEAAEHVRAARELERAFVSCAATQPAEAVLRAYLLDSAPSPAVSH